MIIMILAQDRPLGPSWSRTAARAMLTRAMSSSNLWNCEILGVSPAPMALANETLALTALVLSNSNPQALKHGSMSPCHQLYLKTRSMALWSPPVWMVWPSIHCSLLGQPEASTGRGSICSRIWCQGGHFPCFRERCTKRDLKEREQDRENGDENSHENHNNNGNDLEKNIAIKFGVLGIPMNMNTSILSWAGSYNIILINTPTVRFNFK